MNKIEANDLILPGHQEPQPHSNATLYFLLDRGRGRGAGHHEGRGTAK